MSVGAVQSISRLQYAGFYLPTLILVYLYNKNQKPSVLSGVYAGITDSPEIFLSVLAVSLIGGMISHAINLSIFGHEGPQVNPKDQWTIRYQKYSLFFTGSPRPRPSSVAELENRLDSFISTIFKDRISICKFAFRFIAITFFSIGYLLITILVFFFLIGYMLDSVIELTGILLFLGLAVFELRGLVFKYFPTPVREDTASWIMTAEHHKATTLQEIDEIELKHDPRGLYQSLKHRADLVRQRADMTKSEDRFENDSFLVQLNRDKKYLVDLDEDESES